METMIYAYGTMAVQFIFTQETDPFLLFTCLFVACLYVLILIDGYTMKSVAVIIFQFVYIRSVM